ncbi:MAG: alkaline phosphatase [Maritimibacter sp.]|nr:alkaline phosphatase [Maritimibacter sp.]
MFDWITGIIDAMGGFGVGLLMFLENVFPPIPSELIMPLAGFNAARGDMSLPIVIFWGTVGTLAGAWMWYWIGRTYGKSRLRRLTERHGRWLSIAPEELDRAGDWFSRHEGRAVIIGRLIPAIRTLISVPAGIERMSQGRFLLLSAIGSFLWTTLLAMLGYWLESGYDLVAAWLDPISTGVVIGLITVYVWRVATFDRRQAKRDR